MELLNATYVAGKFSFLPKVLSLILDFLLVKYYRALTIEIILISNHTSFLPNILWLYQKILISIVPSYTNCRYQDLVQR